jgi:hypothetical protein
LYLARCSLRIKAITQEMQAMIESECSCGGVASMTSNN